MSGSFPTVLKIIPLEQFGNRISHFVNRFTASFQRISLKYVLIPVLCELIFTVPLVVFFYREFVRIEAEPSLDVTDTHPNRFSSLIVCGIAVSLIILLFLTDILVSTFSHGHLTEHHKLPVTQARTIGFMFLVVMNPVLYQVIAGLRMSLRLRRFRSKRFRVITIAIMLLAPVSYSLILTTCYCLFEHTNWKYATRLKIYDLQPPEMSLWISGLIAVALMWLSILSSKKFMINRSASPIPSD